MGLSERGREEYGRVEMWQRSKERKEQERERKEEQVSPAVKVMQPKS